MRSLIQEFSPGTIFNPLHKKSIQIKSTHKKVIVKVPARINAMIFDPSSLANPEKKWVYTAGELLFSTKLYTTATITKTKNESIIISKGTKRKSIVLHTARIIRKTLGTKDGLIIKVNTKNKLVHCGFGSSAAIQIAVAIGINELYGKPLTQKELMRFLAQNYGEEIEQNNNKLIHVQSNGGGLAAALYGGGMIVLSGESVIINREPIPNEYSFVIGIPKSYKPLDAKVMIRKEETVFKNMRINAANHSPEIAWLVLHKLLPALVTHDLQTIGSIVDNCKLSFGSLKNDGVLWPELVPKIMKLRKAMDKSTPIISYSSCGPAIFALTKKPQRILKIFKENSLETFTLKADNQGAIVKIS